MVRKGSLRKLNLVVLALAAAGTVASGTVGAQEDNPPPVEPIATLDCPPVVPGNLSAMNAANPTDFPAELVVRFLDKSGKPISSKQIRLEPGASESVELRFDPRGGSGGTLVRGQILQLDGALGILATHQSLRRGFGGLTAGPNVVCTTPNRPF